MMREIKAEDSSKGVTSPADPASATSGLTADDVRTLIKELLSAERRQWLDRNLALYDELKKLRAAFDTNTAELQGVRNMLAKIPTVEQFAALRTQLEAACKSSLPPMEAIKVIAKLEGEMVAALEEIQRFKKLVAQDMDDGLAQIRELYDKRLAEVAAAHEEVRRLGAPIEQRFEPLDVEDAWLEESYRIDEEQRREEAAKRRQLRKENEHRLPPEGPPRAFYEAVTRAFGQAVERAIARVLACAADADGVVRLSDQQIADAAGYCLEASVLGLAALKKQGWVQRVGSERPRVMRIAFEKGATS